MKRNGSVRRVKVSADGEGVVSHAGLGMLCELAEDSGLVGALNAALADTYRGPWLHAPGRVLSDLAVAVADGADAITGIEVLGDREGAFGPVASMPTAWRVLDRALAPAPAAPPVGLDDPTFQYRPVGLEALADDLQSELVQPSERGQVRASEGSVRHVEVFRMGSVRTPIIGRPRPLSDERRADAYAHA